jgi:hypothetical protein
MEGKQTTEDLMHQGSCHGLEHLLAGHQVGDIGSEMVNDGARVSVGYTGDVIDGGNAAAVSVDDDNIDMLTDTNAMLGTAVHIDDDGDDADNTAAGASRHNGAFVQTMLDPTGETALEDDVAPNAQHLPSSLQPESTSVLPAAQCSGQVQPGVVSCSGQSEEGKASKGTRWAGLPWTREADGSLVARTDLAGMRVRRAAMHAVAHSSSKQHCSALTSFKASSLEVCYMACEAEHKPLG